MSTRGSGERLSGGTARSGIGSCGLDDVGVCGSCWEMARRLAGLHIVIHKNTPFSCFYEFCHECCKRDARGCLRHSKC
jgi:hypothetical protein